MKMSLIVLGFIFVVGTMEGILEEYLKFMEQKDLEVSAVIAEQTTSNQPEAFWSLKRGMRLVYKLSRMLIIFLLLVISFVSVLNVIMASLDGGLSTLNWNYVVLMPSLKIYKAFTKVMSDVVNNTDEAVNDVSKVFSGYNTVFGLYENLKSIHTVVKEKETKNSTDKTDDNTQ